MSLWKEKFVKEPLLGKNLIKKKESKAKSELGVEDKQQYNGNILNEDSDENDFNNNQSYSKSVSRENYQKSKNFKQNESAQKEKINMSNNWKQLGFGFQKKPVAENQDEPQNKDESHKNLKKRKYNNDFENEVVIDQKSQKSNLDAIHKQIEEKQKKINFQFKEGLLDFENKLFPQWNENNVIHSPYTYTLMEDAMFLDEGVIITLQYHIFNQESDHILLTPFPEETQFDEEQKQSSSITEIKQRLSKLNTHQYQKNNAHPMSIFQQIPQNFFDDNDIFEDKHEIGEFMSAEEKEIGKKFLIEGVLCFWRSFPSGKMEKMCEKSFTTGMPFAYTRQGNMTIQLTNDKKVLHLTYISNYSAKENATNDGCNKINSDIDVKILAWNIDVKLCVFGQDLKEKFQKLNMVLKEYLIKNKNYIQLIKSIKLSASLENLILTYNEQKNRIDQQNKDQTPQKTIYTVPKQNTKKIAKKYAIFDVQQAALVFEYGGCYQDINMNSPDRIYNLGIAIKDTKIHEQAENPGKPQITAIDEEVAFFCAGKITDWSGQKIQFNKTISKYSETYDDQQLQQKIEELESFNWTFFVKRIKLKDIIRSGLNIEERQKRIKERLLGHSLTLTSNKQSNKDCFQFKSSCITSREDWEVSLVVQVNSNFDQIGVLNIPQITTPSNPRCFFLYHRKSYQVFKENNEFQSNKNYFPSMPIIIKRLPKEGLIYHGRNSQLKKDMYYIVQPPRMEGYAQCLKFDKFGYEQEVELQIKLPNKHNPYNQFDVWCYKEKFMKGRQTINGTIDEEEHLQELEGDTRQVMQICSIDTISLQLELMTKIPRKLGINRYDYLVRSSDTFQQQQAQWPLFAYNLGIEKIAVINLAKQERIRQYIYNVQKGHKFLCFVEFNSYQDIAFFSEGLLIEGCSRIAFLTQNKDYIYLNLLLIDPYHKPMEFCVFTSSHVVNIKDVKAEDMIQNSYVIPSKRSEEVLGNDKEFKIYLVLQYMNIVRRARFKQLQLQSMENEDSDFGMNFDDVYDDSELNVLNKSEPFLEPVYMQLDEKNFLYYVSKVGSVCKIMEINPQKSQMRYHISIFEIKANRCLGFQVSCNGQQFIFIDQKKTMFVLERVIDSRKLKMVSENHMNETFESDFYQRDYDPSILSSKYIISSNKIFYLWKDEAFPNGVFQMENLSDSIMNQYPQEIQKDVKWFQGPIIFSGSNQFGAVD